VSRKTSLFRVAVCAAALLALVTAFGYVDTSATPSSTAQAGQSYLLWAQASTARIWVLDANGGLVREHLLPWDTRPAPGQVWTPRELMMGPDGTRRLLWTEPTSGRSVAWILDDEFRKVGERAFQASNPAANWYTTNLEKNADGSGRLLWFNGFVGSAVLWGLDANDAKVSAKIFAPAADAGAWVPIDYSRAPDGSGRLVWTYVWNGTGPWGGKSAVWFMDGSDTKLGSQVLTYDADWFLRTYHFGNDGRLRFLLANDNQAKGKVCTALTDTTTVPSAEGWGLGKCKTFGPERGWILRSYTGNLPLDLSAHERAMIERESERLGIAPERFVSPTEIRYEDFLLSTNELQIGADGVKTKHIQRWPGGRMYLRFPDHASPAFVQNFLAQCQKWASVAGVSCLSGDLSPRLHVRKYLPGQPCLSNHIGYGDNAYVEVADNGDCVTHELGHALGLIHEHQREDRDSFIRIYEDNIQEQWRDQITDRFRVEGFPFGPYDWVSVMHYGPYDFQKPGITAPTISHLNGSVANLGGGNDPTSFDAYDMQRLYPGTGTVSPAHEFPIATPDPNGPFGMYISSVNVGGEHYTPASMPPVHPGDFFAMTIRVTNDGRPWFAEEGLRIRVKRFGAVNLYGTFDPSQVFIVVDRLVPTDGKFLVPVGASVAANAQPSAVRFDLALLDRNDVELAQDGFHIFITPPGEPAPTGSARVVGVEPQLNVVPTGQMLPFHVNVENPTSHPEVVRVRGYVGGPTVTDEQASFQVRTIEPGQTETFVYSVAVPQTPGNIVAYGQLYTVTGNQAYGGLGSPEVQVVNPPACGGCNFTGIPCGDEGRCVNNPAQGCGFAHACGTYCEESAEVQQVTTVPGQLAPHAPFTVIARVKNLSTQINTLSIRAYTELPGVTPADSWKHEQALQPFETRNFNFSFTAPGSGTLQSQAQVYCPGAPLPFVGNAATPVTISGGGGPYTGIVPSASIPYAGPQPAAPGGTISLYARVHNHNNYTTSFYLRPYSDSPTVQELPRLAVSIPPLSDVTEHFQFAVPNLPGSRLDLHFQVEYTAGQALSGWSETGIPIGGVGPSPSPTPSPEDICPGPDDGDTTGCIPDGQGHQTYRTCQSCRSAYPSASSCIQKQNLGWCWKPQ
jgi:hypothetical protein